MHEMGAHCAQSLNQSRYRRPTSQVFGILYYDRDATSLISTKCEPHKQRSGKDLNGKSEDFLLFVPHMQPCGDKKQIFEQNPHPQLFSLHHELVLQDTMTNCP